MRVVKALSVASGLAPIAGLRCFVPSTRRLTLAASAACSSGPYSPSNQADELSVSDLETHPAFLYATSNARTKLSRRHVHLFAGDTVITS